MDFNADLGGRAARGEALGNCARTARNLRAAHRSQPGLAAGRTSSASS